MTAPMSLKSFGMFGAFLGGGASRGIDEWFELNPDIMDKLQCMYQSSHILRTIIGRIVTETLRGGVDVRENVGPPNGRSGGMGMPSSSPKNRHIRLTKAEQASLRTVLTDAIIYGLVFGLVPITTTSEELSGPAPPPPTQRSGEAARSRNGMGQYHSHAPPAWHSRAAFRVPPPESGRFLGRMDRKGNVQVGWRWRNEENLGTDVLPDKEVFVFVWNRMPPSMGMQNNFNSAVVPLLGELMREVEMVESDAQATYEMNQPPFVIQENPRNYREGNDTHILELNMGNYVRNPAGGDPGRGPGGTLSADQVRMQKKDLGGEVRLNRSLYDASMRTAPGESVRSRIDPCTGETYTVDRTMGYQRGVFKIPTGWVAAPSLPRPALRNDLANQRADIMNRVAATMGMPPLFVTGSGAGIGVSATGGGRGHQAQVGGRSASTNSGEQSVAYETLRTTVMAIREELSDLYGQAHYRLMWEREAVASINRIVSDEQRLYDAQGTDAQLMAKTLELLGDSLAEQIRQKNHRQLYKMDAFKKAAEIAGKAAQLWRGEVIQNRIDSVLGLVTGVDTGTLGYPDGMSLEEVAEREKRGGEGFRPRDPAVLADPNDRESNLTTADEDYDEEGRKRKRKRVQEEEVDPNELAETATERRERIESHGRGVSDSILIHRGPPDGSAGYQRRALSEEIPKFSSALRKAREIVEAREAAERRVAEGRQNLRRVTGKRGDTVVELVWLSQPVPNWDLFEQMAINEILDPEVYRDMMLSHFGFDPERDAPKTKKPFETVRELMQKPEPKPPANAKPKAKSSSSSSSSSSGGQSSKKKQKT